MTRAHEISKELFEEAADWFLRVRSRRADSELHVAWLQWIEADPAHREAFAEVQAIWDSVGQVDPPPWPRPEELAGLTSMPPEHSAERAPAGLSTSAPRDSSVPRGEALSSPSALSFLSRRPQRRSSAGPRRFGAWALVAGVVICVTAVLIARFDSTVAWITGGAEQRIATARGQQQSAVLPDGSRIELGGLTSVDVQFSPQRRLVIADEGEVFYRVEHDPLRPFIVEAGPVSIKAVGTAFSVRREAGTVSVVVTEGVVEVNALSETGTAVAAPVSRVQAGERIRFDQGRLQAVPQPVHTDHDEVWRRGRLRFEDEPLRVVVASLNRYTSKPIVLDDPNLQELRFTGTVFDDRVEDWVAGVHVIFRVTVDESGPDRIVIRARK
jgi:transmembrane sensor